MVVYNFFVVIDRGRESRHTLDSRDRRPAPGAGSRRFDPREYDHPSLPRSYPSYGRPVSGRKEERNKPSEDPPSFFSKS